MFKAAKPPRTGPQKPGIWSDGAQFAPLNLGPLGRVTGLLARRCAADLWNKASIQLSRSAMAVEDGFGATLEQSRGEAFKISPGRALAVQSLTLTAQLLSKAALVVDHKAEPVTPLAFSDLRGFVDQRRTEVAEAKQALARKVELRQSARNRAALLAHRARKPPVPDTPMTGPMTGPILTTSPLDLAAVSTALSLSAPSDADIPAPTSGVDLSIDMSELLAIRQALASIPQAHPIPSAAPVEVAPTPIDKRPAPQILSLAPSESLPETHMAAASLRPPSIPGRLARVSILILGALGRAVRWVLRKIWRQIGPYLTQIVAVVLGWGLAALCAPIAGCRAILLHAKGLDLRSFD